MRIAVLLLSGLLPATLAVQTISLVRHWAGGFQGEPCVDITKELDGWKVHLTFDQDVDRLEVWVADAQKVSPREYILSNKDYNAQEHVGDKLCFTFIGHDTGDIEPVTKVWVEGMDDPAGGQTPSGTTSAGMTGSPGSVTSGSPGGSMTSSPVVTSAPGTGVSDGTKDYATALSNSILFYDAQRSGKLPANNPIPWRDDSAVNDCVPGGWYDAGDHVKFGLPMSSSATLLSWGLVAFKDGYSKAGQLDMMYDMIKWPLDYFLKAWDPNAKELVVQVGDGQADHSFWGRPEDMTMARPCKKISTSSHGSDIAGGTAAAMAAGSIAFKDKGDTAYATQLLTAAESLYSFGKNNCGVFTGASQFYSSSNDKDELCEAAMWLYKATGNTRYLDDAKGFVMSMWAWALGWDDKMVACQQLLWEETKDTTYKDEVVGFFKGWLPGGQITYTPCGLAFRDKWGANRYAANSAFIALISAESGIQTDELRKWGVEQINFLLGDNKHDGGCYSYQIGYGSKFPMQPHHRGASCPDAPAPCSDAQLHASGDSPQILQGALVGGPDASGNYKDDRGDYVHNEVATDYNSGFQGALAGINHLEATNNMPVTNNKCPCNGS